MRNPFILLSVIVSMAALTACKKNESVVNPGTTGTTGTTGSTGVTGVVKTKPDAGVYLVGYKSLFDYPVEPFPSLWKDGHRTQLSTQMGDALAIGVQDTSIIIAGYDKENIGYWKDKRMYPLSKSGGMSLVAIAALGNDVYIAGNLPATGQPAYWKNAERIMLTTPDTRGVVTGMVIKGNDIYISGVCTEATPFAHVVACYWKNGVLHATADNVAESVSTAIAVDDDGNVYMSGYVKGTHTPRTPIASKKPAYWKNNTLNILPIDKNTAVANGIGVNGSNVYVSGTTDEGAAASRGVRWKNGQHTYLPNSKSAGRLFAIQDEVYITGTRQMSTNVTYGVVWKNDDIIAQEGDVTVYNAIYVVK